MYRLTRTTSWLLAGTQVVSNQGWVLLSLFEFKSVEAWTPHVYLMGQRPFLIKMITECLRGMMMNARVKVLIKQGLKIHLMLFYLYVYRIINDVGY